MITPKHLDKGMSFQAYYQLAEGLAQDGKTTGLEQDDERIAYTKLNFARMKRILKTTKVAPEVLETVSCLNDPLTWVILTESWCGDAAQNIPIFAKIQEANPNITLKFLLRDENLDLMDAYLTNGSRSIPKLICIDDQGQELGTWGPRPKVLQDWLAREKANPTVTMSTLKEEFQRWYTQDRGQTLQREMILLLQKWLNKTCFSI